MITDKKQFLIYTVIILAIAVVLNIVSRQLFVRFDLTKNKVYSLSESSKQVISKLEDRMVAKVYFSKDIPGQLANSRRFLQDLLEEYEAWGEGKFRFEFINPDESEDAKSAAQKDGIPPVQMQVIENDKLEIKNVYIGMVLLYSDKKETIPMLKTDGGLEYELTSKIKKLTAVGFKNIGIVNLPGNSSETKKLEEALRETYRVRKYELDQDIPFDVNVLLVNGAADSLSLQQLYHIDQFLQRGGRLFMGQTRQTANIQQGSAADIESNIFDFLTHYGVEIGKSIITDASCGQIQVQQQQGFFRMVNAIDYPVFPIIHHFNSENLMVRDFEEARIFFPNEIAPADTVMDFTWLMRTSNRTGAVSGPYYIIYPLQNPVMEKFPNKEKTVAALFRGAKESYFANRSDFEKGENFISGSVAELAIIADLKFFDDQRAASVEENLALILNGVDYLAGDEELISIRSRGVTSRPLKQLSDGERSFWKWINIALPATLALIFALLRWRRNREQRRILEEIYG
jgi:gliding-associated putative ABC transporter substrate-binding component GldG